MRNNNHITLAPDEEVKAILKRADISTRADQVLDLEGRYPQIADTIVKQTGFILEAEIGKSTWWGNKVGAVMYRGYLPIETQAKPAVLKIEAVEMQSDELTEVTMIRKAEKALAGSGIRPPKIYRELPWTTDNGGYSAIFMEAVPTNHPVLPVPGTEQEIAALLTVRERYKNALQINKVTPWVGLDILEGENYVSQFVRTKFEGWKKASKDNFPHHPFRKPTDEALIDRAIKILEKEYEGVSPEFLQGHFSHRDVVTVGNETIMFSNLYWGWRVPFYDAVFPSHWYMYELTNVKDVTIDQINQQREMWNRQYKKMTDTLSPNDKRLFALAQLERLAAGLTIDALSISQNSDNKIATYMVNQTRNELVSTLDKLS